jgi:transcriptional regulator with XRE-family HTH domain
MPSAKAQAKPTPSGRAMEQPTVSRRRDPNGRDPSIGIRLAELRKEHRYSIRSLAARASVSASLISDVERGKVEPSISTLKRVAGALGTTLTYFFSDPSESNSRVVRATERVALSRGTDRGAKGEARSAVQASGISFELASPEQAESIEAVFGRYEVGASLGYEPVIWIDAPKSF